MGEAERSIAIKRRIIAPKTAEREDSPSEIYTPKRKKSSSGPEASPPPYIPSRKESTPAVGKASLQSASSQQREADRRRGHAESRSDHIRQTLSSQDRRELVSRSRRMEPFKHIGIDRKDVSSSDSSRRTRQTHQSPRRGDGRKVAERVQSEKVSSHITREVSGRIRDVGDGVKDLKIKARLGPAVKTPLDEAKASTVKDERVRGGLDLRNKMSSSLRGTDTLQIIVNPVTSPALKGSVASRLGKIVVKRHGPVSDGGDDDDVTAGEAVSKGRMAISRHAKSLVNKQCREAVLSVNTGGRRLRRSVSPDSRRVEASGDTDGDDEEHEEEDEGDLREEEENRSEVVSDGKSVCITVKQTVKSQNREGDERGEVNDKVTVVKDVDDEEKEPEDLADMIGEKLAPELLDDTVQDELNLDLETEVDADDIETMIGVKSEEDKPKPGTRFIVTLDGVDERQLYAEGSEDGGKNMESPSPYIQPQAMAVDPMQKLSPSSHPPYIPQLKNLPPPHPSQPPHQQMPPPLGVPIHANPSPSSVLVPGAFPPLHYNVGDPQSLPPPINSSIIPRVESTGVKPVPPKIQPFSINLKDSDDEFEDKESRMQTSSTATAGYISQEQAVTTSLSALQKAKLSERCKFWPACAAGSECEFHHPTSYCKTFPNCKFADKCLFIHPNCRFDSKCTRQDCPFTHTSRRLGLSTSSPGPSLAPTIPFHHTKLTSPLPVHSTTISTVCRFFPQCHNPACLFLHPKPCRFGPACQNSGCPFYHPTPAVVVPTKDKLKWKAHTVPASLPKDIPPTSFSSTTSLSTSADPTTKFRQPVAKVSPMSAATSSSSIR